MSDLISRQEFADEMRRIADDQRHDEEIKHIEADDLMMRTLTALGYGEGVIIFSEMNKWYA